MPSKEVVVVARVALVCNDFPLKMWIIFVIEPSILGVISVASIMNSGSSALGEPCTKAIENALRKQFLKFMIEMENA
ncbi:hypothetical protein J437_LFUL015931 [Ladona fulva]|uniref:Uncharacterized protein n=1 Tax=Ladona fulva TaxID=123851 RepID=A0A8K0K294_LADFU|nr:hypothetical protein J437_LFUL015931 [Ladona fulva]